MALQSAWLPHTFKRYLLSELAQELERSYSSASDSLEELLNDISSEAEDFQSLGNAGLTTAFETVRSLNCLYARRESRDFMVQHGLMQYAAFWEQILIPVYAWTLHSLWTDAAGIQTDNRTLVSDLKANLETLIANFMPSKPHYHQLDDLPLESWDRLLPAIATSQIPACLARELQTLRQYLISTAKFPQPAVHVHDATRCLLLCARILNLGLRRLDLCPAIADAHLLEHACALRLTLAERPWSWDAWDVDSCLFGALKRAALALPWRWLLGVPSCTSATVTLATPLAKQRLPRDMPATEATSCQQLWRALSHATVQCYLGWWLAASMAVLRPGSADFSLPAVMLVTCRGCWQRRVGDLEDMELRGLQAPLCAAAALWLYGGLTGQSRVQERADAGTADTRTSAGEVSQAPVRLTAARNPAAGTTVTSTDDIKDERAAIMAHPRPHVGVSASAAGSAGTAATGTATRPTAIAQPAAGTVRRASVADRPSSASRSAAADATTNTEADEELPYSAQNMYDMIAPVAEHCVDFVATVSTLGSRFADALSTAALSLVLSLRDMPLDAAAARLPSCWQILGRILAMDLGSSRSRTVRDLAQAAGRALQIHSRTRRSPQPSGPPSRPVSSLATDRPVTRYGSRNADVVSPGGADAAGDGGSSGRSGPPAPLAPWEALEQDAASWVASAERRYQLPSHTLQCALASVFLPSLERTLRALLYVPEAAPQGAALAVAADGNGTFGLHGSKFTSRAEAMYDLASACVAVDMALRRPGCWPALLAHAPQQQLAPLILTMRKLTIAAGDMLLQPPVPTARVTLAAAAAATAMDAEPSGDPRVLWRIQLIALLEQCLPFTRSPAAAAAAVSASGAAAAKAAALAKAAVCRRSSPDGSSPIPNSPSQLSSLGAVLLSPVPEVPGPHLLVNAGLCGGSGSKEPERSSRGGGRYFGGGGGGGRSSSGDSAWEDDRELDIRPGWYEILGFGACPAVGSLARLQQERLMVLSVAAWLPLLITTQEDDGGSGRIGNVAASTREVPVPVANLAVHGGHRVAWEWLLVIARQCLGARGTAAHASWMQLLRRLQVVDQISAVLRLYCTWVRWSHRVMTTEVAVALSASGGAAGVGTVAPAGAAAETAVGGTEALRAGGSFGSGTVSSSGVGGVDLEGRELHDAAARAAEILPTALDVLETLVAAAPEAIALALADNRKARHLASVAEDLTNGSATDDGDGQVPYPGAGSPAALAQHQRRRLERQRREDRRQAALPPGWGPGLPLDQPVVSVLTLHCRHGLMKCLGELSRVSGDRFSFQPQGLGAVDSWLQDSGSGGGGGWLPLPDPDVVLRQQLGFPVCGNEGCSNLEGSSEATLLLRACGVGRGHVGVCYCCVTCQQAGRQAAAAAAAAVKKNKTHRSEGRRALGRS